MIHEERVVPREKISPVSLRNKEMGFFYRIGKFFLIKALRYGCAQMNKETWEHIPIYYPVDFLF